MKSSYNIEFLVNNQLNKKRISEERIFLTGISHQQIKRTKSIWINLKDHSVLLRDNSYKDINPENFWLSSLTH